MTSDQTARSGTRTELLKYVDAVMSAKYGSDLHVTHVCGDENESSTKPAKSTLRERTPQTLRDARHKDLAWDIKGQLMECIACNEPFSGTDLVNMSLLRWRDFLLDDIQMRYDVQIPLSTEQLDIAAYRHSYDIDNPGLNNNAFWDNQDVRRMLLRLRFDEHDCMHRKTCFKHGIECRSLLPMPATEKSCIYEDPTKEVTWERVDSTSVSTRSYLVMPERPMGCQYLNSHQIFASDTLGCNTNLSIGDPVHTYYSTMYCSKSTQEEDKQVYQRIALQIGRRIERQRRLAEGEGEEQRTDPSFVEGLGRILSGISASLITDKVAAPMAHLMVCQGGKRFTFSHEFDNLLLSQVGDVLDEKEVSFYLRTNKGTDGTPERWPDSFANDYLFRPGELEHMCLYEMVMIYKKCFKTFKQMEKDEDNDNEDDGRESDTKLLFLEEHPGRRYSHMTKRKRFVIPKIFAPHGAFCDIKHLKLKENHTLDNNVIEARETYAKYALMLFLPFRDKLDLEGKDETHWTLFQEAKMEGGNLWKRGLDILQNMQTRIDAGNTKRGDDPLSQKTKCSETEPESKSKRQHDDKEDDENDITTMYMQMFQQHEEQELVARTNEQLRSHSVLTCRAKIGHDKFMKTKVENGSLFSHHECNDDQSERASLHERDTSDNDTRDSPPQSPLHLNQCRFADLLVFVKGSLVGSTIDNNGDGNEDGDEVVQHVQRNEINSPMDTPASPRRRLHGIPSMTAFAAEQNETLDDKQHAAYEIICSSFLLNLINEMSHLDAVNISQLNSVLGSHSLNERKLLIKALKSKGAEEQLLMFLTGPGGCGKSTVMSIAERFCHAFCQAASIIFDETTFLYTATTGTAAALFGGNTIHSAAFLNRSKIYEEDCESWKNVRLLIIDEISYFLATDLENLDAKLRRIRSRKDVIFGGMSIVFAGDFHQLQPVKVKPKDFLYSYRNNSLWDMLNSAIILENNHRFKDKEFGEILRRMRMGEDTVEDRKKINTRVIGTNGVTLPDPTVGDVCYACPTNNERCAVTAGVFWNHIMTTHPDV